MPDTRHYQQGYAALAMTLFVVLASFTIIGGLTFFSFQEVAANRAYTESADARFVAEAGIEDAIYRVVSGKEITGSETLAVGQGVAQITVTTSGAMRTIRSEGVQGASNQNVETQIAVTVDSIDFHYGVHVGDGGLEMSNNSQVNGNVYSNGDIAGNAGATIMGDAIVAGGISTSPQVEWTADNSDQPYATSTASRDIAQSFTATSAGAVPKVSVLIGKVGSPAGDITLRITRDNGGKPSTISMASALIKNSSVGVTPSWIDVAFSSPPTLTGSTKYWIVLDYGFNSTMNYWNWRKDDADAYASNTGRYADDWNSGSAVWRDTNGDFGFKVWIGGANTQIANVTIGDAISGTGRANIFVNDVIHGSTCPNSYCIVENPSRAELPISDGVIHGWKDAAEAGGITSGDVTVSGAATILGPQKINGKLTVINGAVLTVAGTLWVTGDIVFDNNSITKLVSSYGTMSGVIISDAKIDVKNNAAVSGSGNPYSFMMILAAKDSTGEELINVDNNSLGAIYYAGGGWIKFSNNAAAKEATAYGIRLDNNAVITYDSDLANAQFSSGPGGGYDITYWRSVE